MIDRHTPFGPTHRLAGVPRRFGRLLRARAARRGLSVDRRDVPRILGDLGAVRPDAASWVVQDSRSGEPSILILGPSGEPPVAVVRVARSRSGQAGLDRAGAALEQLHLGLASLDVDALLPVTIGQGALPGRTWHAESALSGRPAREMLLDPEARRRMLVATARVIGRIHAATSRPRVVDDALVGRWVGARIRTVAGTLRRGRGPRDAGGALARIEASVAADLHGRTLDSGWIHGDLWPANVLVGDDTPAISGIVDWDSAEDDELALHDRLHLAITTRRLVARSELGPVLAALLTGGAWSDDDRAVLDAPSTSGAGRASGTVDGLAGLPERTALWLYWLRFVESNVARHPDLATDRAWLRANVEQVLACA